MRVRPIIQRGARFGVPLVLAALVLVPGAFAQGKIAGRVTEAGGGPLPGVNIIVEETGQGTVTDPDGNYVILNVRPGTYTVVYSFIGFQRQRVEGLRVTTGQTTRYNISLREEVIEGDEVLIVAERPLVQKDLTASKKTVVAAEIDALPVESFFGVLVTQAGVNQGPGGTIHIRGGRSNEVSYLIDGLRVSNPFDTNGLATSVAADAIQEMTVISGAFNAEYGKAMSGIVNLVTKEGGERYSGSLSVYGGDTITRHDDLFLKPNGVRLNDYTAIASLSGPVPFLKRLRFFMSGRRDVDDGYIFGRREHSPADSANFNEDPWYYELRGQPWPEVDPDEAAGERVALNPASGYNFIGKLSTRPYPGTKVEYQVLLDGGERTPFNFAYRFNPDGVAPRSDYSVNHSLHWTHTLTNRMFYTVKLSRGLSDFKSRRYEDPFDPRYVPTNLIVGFPGINFLMGGNQKGHLYERAVSYRAKADVVRQFGAIHEAKAGVELEHHNLDRENFTVLYDRDIYRVPTVTPIGTPAHDKYGCHEFVDVSHPDDPPCRKRTALQLSAYAQDKLEFDNFIINVGLRFERYSSNGQYLDSLLTPTGVINDADSKSILLPRVGVSFPITEEGIIHFSYGHFAQIPTLRQMFVNPEFEFPVGSIPTFGNANLRPERSVQYEIGLQQQIGAELAVNVSGFFKDIRDYLALQRIRFSTISGEDQYNIYLNKDYANVKGVTFALTKRRSRNGLLSATVDYTFQVAEGNRDDANAFFFNFVSGRENELELVPLDFDQRHIVSSTVTLTRPGNWSASFITQFSTGYPYSPLLIDQKIDDLPNSARKPAQVRIDAHVYKTFKVDRFSLRTFAKVFNVIDRLNERFVFDDTGRATYSLGQQRGQHLAWEPFYGQTGIHDWEEYTDRPHWYSAPREIQLGLAVNF